ncbi:MAG TPA: hypothetical protein VFE28_02400 [Candidatus Krumholzibacteria bacterium]|nr:hypothetical protein [Candidatus Krumholzibacteria bacterium]
MNLLGVGILAAVALTILVILVRTAGRAYWRSRGERVVQCPETGAPAGVSVDAKAAALAALRGTRELELSSCTRWPERAGCGQDCVREIEKAPEGCLVRQIVAAWFEGKSCVLCGKDLSHIDWTTHKPGLMHPERRILAWHEVAAVEVRAVLETHQPMCWDCQIIETLVQRYPERVTFRPRHS